jgi:DNA-binding GntR family transcriptional regulator
VSSRTPAHFFTYDPTADKVNSGDEPLIRTMSGQITSRIREKILAGTYEPGAQLLQDGIAAEFGVSKIPVREALVQLRSEGLVEIFAHKGFQVRLMSAAEVDEVFSLRLAIEPDAVAHGARLASAADRSVAKVSLDALNAALSVGELASSGDLNATFHLSLIVPRRQRVTYEILSRLHIIAQRYVRVHLMPKGRVKRATQEHTALYEAWAAGKSNEARKVTQAHIGKTRDELKV